MHAPAAAVELRVRGYDAAAVKERADLMGLADQDLLEAATAEGRALVTENVKDFAALAQRSTAAGEQHAGLVFTHPRRFPRAARYHMRMLADALAIFIDEQAATLGGVRSFVWWLETARP